MRQKQQKGASAPAASSSSPGKTPTDELQELLQKLKLTPERTPMAGDVRQILQLLRVGADPNTAVAGKPSVPVLLLRARELKELKKIIPKLSDATAVFHEYLAESPVFSDHTRELCEQMFARGVNIQQESTLTLLYEQGKEEKRITTADVFCHRADECLEKSQADALAILAKKMAYVLSKGCKISLILATEFLTRISLRISLEEHNELLVELFKRGVNLTRVKMQVDTEEVSFPVALARLSSPLDENILSLSLAAKAANCLEQVISFGEAFQGFQRMEQIKRGVEGEVAAASCSAVVASFDTRVLATESVQVTSASDGRSKFDNPVVPCVVAPEALKKKPVEKKVLSEAEQAERVAAVQRAEDTRRRVEEQSRRAAELARQEKERKAAEAVLRAAELESLRALERQRIEMERALREEARQEKLRAQAEKEATDRQRREAKKAKKVAAKREPQSAAVVPVMSAAVESPTTQRDVSSRIVDCVSVLQTQEVAVRKIPKKKSLSLKECVEKLEKLLEQLQLTTEVDQCRQHNSALINALQEKDIFGVVKVVQAFSEAGYQLSCYGLSALLKSLTQDLDYANIVYDLFERAIQANVANEYVCCAMLEGVAPRPGRQEIFRKVVERIPQTLREKVIRYFKDEKFSEVRFEKLRELLGMKSIVSLAAAAGAVGAFASSSSAGAPAAAVVVRAPRLP